MNFEKFKKAGGKTLVVPPSKNVSHNRVGYVVPCDEGFDKLVGLSNDGINFQWVNKNYR